MTQVSLPPGAPAHESTASRRGRGVSEYMHWLVIAIAIGYFVLLACLYLDRPGLYYDETIFVPAALGGQYTQVGFVSSSFDGIPTMIMSYIGAFKSALFAPIFAMFGVSVVTIRVTAIVISAVTLVLGYLLGRQFLGKWSSVILVLLMATSSSFIFMTKVDWGPMVLPMLLKIAVLVAFFRLLHTGQIRYLWIVGILSLLGIYDKEDFSWLIVALSVAAVAVYGRRLWAIYSAQKAHTIFALGLLIIAGGVLADKVIVPNLGTPGNSSLQNPFPHLAYSWNGYQGILGQADLLGFWANQGTQPAWMSWSSALVLVALVFLLLTRLWRGALPSQVSIPTRAAIFFLIIFIVMLLEIAATKAATGPHHVIELWPFQDLILLGSASAALQTIWPNRAPQRTTASGARLRTPSSQASWLAALSLLCAGLALCTTIATQAVSTYSLESLMQTPDAFRPVFRTDDYRIAGFINANSSQIDQVVTANWGMGMQLFSLACPDWRGKVHDGIWWSFSGANTQTATALIRQQFGDQRVLVVDINDQSQQDLPPSLRISASVFEQAYATIFPNRHPVTVLATTSYNVIYFGPPDQLKNTSSPDEGCSAQGSVAASKTLPAAPAENSELYSLARYEDRKW